MLNTTNNHPVRLRIWQENLNKSSTAQHCILSGPITARDWDIVAIQEPVIDDYGNTKATLDWNVIYPTHRYTHQSRARAVTLIHKRLNTNNWRQIPFPSADVVVIQLSGPFGIATIFNIYDDSTKRETIPLLATFLEKEIRNIRPTQNDHMIWLGDFNAHHFLWEEERNAHLCTTGEAQEVAQQIIELMADYDMQMALPKGRPTLQSTSSGNWTRPDNFFCTAHTLNMITSCDTKPRRRPPCTDHVPILSTLELNIPRSSNAINRNFREVEWKEFRSCLSARLSLIPPPMVIKTEAQFQTAARDLAETLEQVIAEKVPKSKPCPHAKRWWTKELTLLIMQKDKLSDESYKLRGLPNHPVHQEHRKMRNRVKEAIRRAKQEHWTNFLEELNQETIYTANKFITTPYGDGGRTSVPVLNFKTPDGTPGEAITNEEKSKALARSFFPPPPATSTVPQGFNYPSPAETFKPFTEEEIRRTIANTSPYKAPGPDGICNIVFKQCAELLTPYLTHLFNAVFDLNTYYDPWREFTTVVLRKPGKPDYTVPKAYRPIALINTTCKLLTALVAERVTIILERHNLLPNTHFGGRPGRTTTDSLHLLEVIVKNAWRSGNVASILFLDIEGTFPNAVTDRLIHNMRKRRIPSEITRFTERMLTGRRTQLKFNDTTSEWIPICNGIGQGDPLSMIAYLIYCADLIDIANPKNKETALAFVDDTAFVAVGKTFVDTHRTLKNMMERPNGALQWSREHNSKFEVNKFALIDFTRSRTRLRPTLRIANTPIEPAKQHRFLGLIVDQELTWKQHTGHAIAKGTEYVLQLRRLSKPAHGVSAQLMRKLYLTVAVPKFTYGADVWFKPTFAEDTRNSQRGSLGTAKCLEKVQRIVTLNITGAMRTTASDILEAHAFLLPIPLLLQKVCQRAALRLASLPQGHPLYKHLTHIVKHIGIKRHRSSLHNLLKTFRAFPDDVETIDPIKRLTHVTSNAHHTFIAPTKDIAIKEQRELKDEIQIYSDGSSHNGGVGAAAILLRKGQEPRILRYHLGQDKHHTVFEAELVGLTLATKLLATEQQVTYPATIFVDNKAAIQSGETSTTKSGSYLVDTLRRMIHTIAKCRHEQELDFDLTVRWIPGHKDVEGNELADKEAKKAAEGRSNSSTRRLLPSYLRTGTLPHSIAALKQWHQDALLKRWKEKWSTSPRYARARTIDPSLPSKNFLKLVNTLPKCQISIYTQLRTRHIPLNHHLHRIGKSETPHCPTCPGRNETIHHFLFDCPQYAHERHIMSNALRRKASSIEYILTADKATKPLMRFINSTGRLRPTFGEITVNS